MSDRLDPEALVNAGYARESFAPIGSNLPGYDNYFCRDCRGIVHVPDSGVHAADWIWDPCHDAEAEGRRKSQTGPAGRIRTTGLRKFEYPCPPAIEYPCPFAAKSLRIRIAMPISSLIYLRPNTS